MTEPGANLADLLQRVVAVEKISSPEFVRTAFEIWRSGRTLMAVDLPQNDQLPLLFGGEAIRVGQGGGWLEEDFHLEENGVAAQIAFTSGTTGKPKPVVLSRRSLIDVTTRLHDIMDVTPDIREYIGVPVTFSFGLGRARAVTSAGGRAFLPAAGFRPAEVSEMLASGQINALSAVPTMLRLIIGQSEIFDVCGKHLRWLEIGSQFMSAAEKEKIRTIFPNACIAQHYGLTEASRSSFLRIDAVDLDALASVGKANGEVEIRINDEQRIQIRGPHVADGNLIDGKLVPLVDAQGWLTTNDLGSIDEAGYLHYLGRSDDQVNISGIKVPSELFEQALAQNTSLAHGSFAVGPIDDPLRGEALLVGHTSPEASQELMEELPSLAERFGINRTDIMLRRISAIPKTATGKVRRRELAKAVEPADTEKTDEATSDTLTERLAELLSRPEIDRSSSYVELGADSLTHVQVALLIEERLGKLPADWERIPVGELEKLELAPEQRPSAGEKRLDPEYLLRAIAIIGVVATHTLWSDLKGGAYLLYLLAGTAFARFQLPKFMSPDKSSSVFRPLIRILIGYYLILAFYQFVRGEVDIAHWLLVSNFSPSLQSEYSLLPYYWFIAAFCQSYVISAAVFFLVLRKDGGQRASLWTTCLTIFMVSFALSMLSGGIFAALPDAERYTEAPFAIRTPLSIFYLFALGLCIAFATTTRRRLLLTGLALLTLPFVGNPSIALWLVLGTMIILWAKSVALNRYLCAAVVAVASASLYIFLIHMFPVQLYRELGQGNLVMAAGVICLSIVAGIIMMKVIAAMEMTVRSKLMRPILRSWGRREGAKR